MLPLCLRFPSLLSSCGLTSIGRVSCLHDVTGSPCITLDLIRHDRWNRCCDSRLALKGGHFSTSVIKSFLFLFSNSFHFFVIFSCWSLPRIYAVSSYNLRLLCVTARQMNPSRRLTQVSRNLQVISNWTDWTKKMAVIEWFNDSLHSNAIP